MRVSLVMTAIGRDRPGLVEMLARLVADHGGNWLESRMCRLGGEFAGILRVDIAREQANVLIAALEDLGSKGLNVVVREDEPARTVGGRTLVVGIVGQDRPGIIREISSALASQQVNVEELESECASAPMSGETLFKARARLVVPETCDAEQLRQRLERIAADLLVDIDFEEVAKATAAR
jgi:glycine cleavage system regulatory protein